MSTLYRIQALEEILRFGVVEGELGGWVESEKNLSQEMQRTEGVSAEFIQEAKEYAQKDSGFSNLMCLWIEASNNPEEREELISAMQEKLEERSFWDGWSKYEIMRGRNDHTK